MALSAQVGAELGQLDLFIGQSNSVMPPKFWAEQAANRIMHVAESAPMPIRAQAEAFKKEIFIAVLHAVHSAINERRARDALLAEPVSMALADQIRKD